MKKTLKWIVLALVVVIGIALVVVYFNLNKIIRSTIETQATQSLDLKTELQGVNLSLFGGKLALNDLKIASPQGFSAPRLFELGGAAVQVDYGQLTQQPVRIREIVIDRPQLVIEQAGGKFNFQVLMDQQSQPPAPTDPSAEPLRLIIEQLRITSPRVDLYPGIPGLAQHIKIPIPTLELKNIGTADEAQNGAAIKEVVMLIVTTMAQKAAESDQIPADVRQLLSLNVDQVRQQLQAELQRQLGKLTDDLGKKLPGELGNVLKSATQPGGESGAKDNKPLEEGLKGLLGGEKRQQK